MVCTLLNKKINVQTNYFVKTGVLSLVKDGAIMVGTEVEKRIGEDRMKIVEEIKNGNKEKCSHPCPLLCESRDTGDCRLYCDSFI